MTDTIENGMARLMERPAFSGQETLAPTYPPAAEKVFAILDRFVEKYGSAHLEVFRLPSSSASELQRYLNSLTITLKRQGIIISYTWQYHSTENAYYLFLFHNKQEELFLFLLWSGGKASCMPANGGGWCEVTFYGMKREKEEKPKSISFKQKKHFLPIYKLSEFSLIQEKQLKSGTIEFTITQKGKNFSTANNIIKKICRVRLFFLRVRDIIISRAN